MDVGPDELELELGRWWRRAVAALLDFALGAAVVLTLAGLLIDVSTLSALQCVLFAIVAFVLASALAALLSALAMARTDGQSLGKRLLGLRVVHADGQAMTLRRALYRELFVKLFLVDVVGGSMAVAFFADRLWPLWDQRSRALHDVVARTFVVVA